MNFGVRRSDSNEHRIEQAYRRQMEATSVLGRAEDANRRLELSRQPAGGTNRSVASPDDRTQLSSAPLPRSRYPTLRLALSPRILQKGAMSRPGSSGLGESGISVRRHHGPVQMNSGAPAQRGWHRRSPPPQHQMRHGRDRLPYGHGPHRRESLVVYANRSPGCTAIASSRRCPRSS